MPYGDKEYQASVTLVKAAWEFVKVLGLGSAAVLGIFYQLFDQIPKDWETLRTTWPLVLVGVVGAAWRAYNNWRKNGNGGALLPMLLAGALFIGLVTSATGCDKKEALQNAEIGLRIALIAADRYEAMHQPLSDDDQRELDNIRATIVDLRDLVNDLREDLDIDPLPVDDNDALKQLKASSDATP